MNSLAATFEKAWYKKERWLYALWPVSVLFMLISSLRRFWLLLQIKNEHDASDSSNSSRNRVPVIIVGNIAVGGTGKTPLVITLVNELKKRGIKAGVISRGYGGNAPSYPYVVNESSEATEAGDEALVIVKNTQCPMVVDSKRSRALQKLLSEFQCDVVISDDGLQHYALRRDKEIVVIDGVRKLGNGLCLPAGPLRESVSRLNTVDYIIYNGSPDSETKSSETKSSETKSSETKSSETKRSEAESIATASCNISVMEQRPVSIVNLLSGETVSIDDALSILKANINALAAIGNPQRFFQSLKNLGFALERRIFPDHYSFSANDFNFANEYPVVMTQKDAVKCKSFAKENYWYLKIEAELNESFSEKFFAELVEMVQQREVDKRKDQQKKVDQKNNATQVCR